jgi:hypothetical protein
VGAPPKAASSQRAAASLSRVGIVFAVKKYIESELFGLRGGDPVAMAGATLLLTCVALAAGIWPAWRASRLDPMVALRQE